MASPNKWNVYEKNSNTGEILPEKKSCFDKILCAESENHMVNTLGKSVVDSLSTGGASFLFIGKNDKLFLLQLILRLLVDELGSRGTNQFMLTCSKNMASILETFFGDDDPTLPANTFKVESNLFDLFGQVSDRLDEHMAYDEFFCQIELQETRFSQPVTLLFAGCSPKEELKKVMPTRRNELDQFKFLRHAILQNFKLVTDSTSLAMFIDTFISQNVKMVFTFTHLVNDYMHNDFLIEVANNMKRTNNILMPSVRNNSTNVNAVRRSSHLPSEGYIRDGRRTKTPNMGSRKEHNIDDRVRDASDHVRNIFRYMN